MTWAATLDQMEATSSRNELVCILTDVAYSVDELEPILSAQRLAPVSYPKSSFWE